MPHRITIHINHQVFHLDHAEVAPDEFRSLVTAPSDYEVWKTVKSPDPEGQLPVDDIQITSPVTVENGDHYRVVPPGTFGSVRI
jgi:hypothetical protein